MTYFQAMTPIKSMRVDILPMLRGRLYTVKDLAALTKVDYSTIQSWERGRCDQLPKHVPIFKDVFGFSSLWTTGYAEFYRRKAVTISHHLWTAREVIRNLFQADPNLGVTMYHEFEDQTFILARSAFDMNIHHLQPAAAYLAKYRIPDETIDIFVANILNTELFYRDACQQVLDLQRQELPVIPLSG